MRISEPTMRRWTIPLAAFCVLLAACVPMDVRESADVPTPPRAATGTALPVPPAVEAPPARSSVGMKAMTGSLLERIVGRGILEIGVPDAPLTLTVFTHPSCPYCRDFAREHAMMLEREFVDPGILRVRTVIVPLKKYSSSAVDRAALLCAGAFEKGKGMFAALTDADVHTRKTIAAMAQTLGIPGKQFSSCLDAKETEDLLGSQAEFISGHSVTLLPALLLDEELRIGLPTSADLRGWIREARESL